MRLPLCPLYFTLTLSVVICCQSSAEAKKKTPRRPGGQCQCSVLPALKAYSEVKPSQRTTYVFRMGDVLAQLRSVRRYVVFNSTGRNACP